MKGDPTRAPLPFYLGDDVRRRRHRAVAGRALAAGGDHAEGPRRGPSRQAAALRHRVGLRGIRGRAHPRRPQRPGAAVAAAARPGRARAARAGARRPARHPRRPAEGGARGKREDRSRTRQGRRQGRDGQRRRRQGQEAGERQAAGRQAQSAPGAHRRQRRGRRWRRHPMERRRPGAGDPDPRDRQQGSLDRDASISPRTSWCQPAPPDRRGLDQLELQRLRLAPRQPHAVVPVRGKRLLAALRQAARRQGACADPRHLRGLRSAAGRATGSGSTCAPTWRRPYSYDVYRVAIERRRRCSASPRSRACSGSRCRPTAASCWCSIRRAYVPPQLAVLDRRRRRRCRARSPTRARAEYKAHAVARAANRRRCRRRTPRQPIYAKFYKPATSTRRRSIRPCCSCTAPATCRTCTSAIPTTSASRCSTTC